MKGAMVVAVVLTVARVSDAAEPRQLPMIHLEMANEAKVSTAVLKRSRDEVARIFAGVGFAVEWTETGPRFTVQIATSPPQSSSSSKPC